MEGNKKDKAVPDGKIVARGLPLHEAVEELMDEVVEDFPRAWRERQCIINSWICLTALTLLLCPMGLVGEILAFIGGGLYVCRCCRPSAKVAGKKASKLIFIMALITAIADLAMEIILVILGVMYLSHECKGEDGERYVEELCDMRKLFGLILLGSAVILFLHLLFSLTVFISMRNCHLSINKYECHLQHIEESRRRRAKKARRKRRPRHKDQSKGQDGTDNSNTSISSYDASVSGSKKRAPPLKTAGTV